MPINRPVKVTMKDGRTFAGLRTGRASAHLLEPVNVHAFWASHEPSLTISPVDMLSFHVDQYLPLTLS